MEWEKRSSFFPFFFFEPFPYYLFPGTQQSQAMLFKIKHSDAILRSAKSAKFMPCNVGLFHEMTNSFEQ
jgi:hypothetical protein